MLHCLLLFRFFLCVLGLGVLGMYSLFGGDKHLAHEAHQIGREDARPISLSLFLGKVPRLKLVELNRVRNLKKVLPSCPRRGIYR